MVKERESRDDDWGNLNLTGILDADGFNPMFEELLPNVYPEIIVEELLPPAPPPGTQIRGPN